MAGVRPGLYGRGFACERQVLGKGWSNRCLGTSIPGERFPDGQIISALVGEQALVDFLFALNAVNEFSGGIGVSTFLEGSELSRREG